MSVDEFSAFATLDLWQSAEDLPPVERSLAIAAAASAEPVSELARMPLGRRDARLLELHTALHGRTLEAVAPCPACGQQAEFAVDAEALSAREAKALDVLDGDETATLEVDGFLVHWRPPNSRDAAVAALAREAAEAELVLVSRCVTGASGPDGEVSGTALPASVRAELGRAMADADPLAEVLIEVACPACQTAFAADLDIAEFVWTELQARAARLLHDVDALARAYGWTEAEVLALDERRRRAYLELADGSPT